jgi:hypothetical protein
MLLGDDVTPAGGSRVHHRLQALQVRHRVFGKREVFGIAGDTGGIIVLMSSAFTNTVPIALMAQYVRRSFRIELSPAPPSSPAPGTEGLTGAQVFRGIPRIRNDQKRIRASSNWNA